MSTSSKTTTDPEVIREWAEARGGKPARVKNTATDDDRRTGLLRIDFPGFSGEESLETIDWDTFSKTFESQELAFVYGEKDSDGKISRFSKFISRSSTDS